MSTPIPITENTIVKTIVRSGTELERRQVILSEGEPGYTLDTKRFFVGDGRTPGGIPVTQKFRGQYTTIVTEAYNVSSPPLPGDTASVATGVLGSGFYVLRDYPIDLSGRQLSSWGSVAGDWFRLSQTDYDPTSAISGSNGIQYIHTPGAGATIKLEPSEFNLSAGQLLIGNSSSTWYDPKGEVFQGDSRQVSLAVVDGYNTNGGTLFLDNNKQGVVAVRPTIGVINAKSDRLDVPSRMIHVGTFQSHATDTLPDGIEQGSAVVMGCGVASNNIYSTSSSFVGLSGNPATKGGLLRLIYKPYGSQSLQNILSRYWHNVKGTNVVEIDPNHLLLANSASTTSLTSTVVDATTIYSRSNFYGVAANVSTLYGSTSVVSPTISATGGTIITCNSTTVNAPTVNSTNVYSTNLFGAGTISGAWIVTPGQVRSGSTLCTGMTVTNDINSNSATIGSLSTSGAWTGFCNGFAVVERGGTQRIVVNGSGENNTTRNREHNALLVNAQVYTSFDGRVDIGTLYTPTFYADNATINNSLTVNSTVGAVNLVANQSVVAGGAVYVGGWSGPTISNSGGAIRPSRFAVNSLTTATLPLNPTDLEIAYDSTRGALLMYFSSPGAWATVDGVYNDVKYTADDFKTALYRNPGWAICGAMRGRLPVGATDGGYTVGYVGRDNSDNSTFDTGGVWAAGGETYHWLAENELPAHRHKFYDVCFGEEAWGLQSSSSPIGHINLDGTYCFGSDDSGSRWGSPYNVVVPATTMDDNTGHTICWNVDETNVRPNKLTEVPPGGARPMSQAEPRGAGHYNIPPYLTLTPLRKTHGYYPGNNVPGNQNTYDGRYNIPLVWS